MRRAFAIALLVGFLAAGLPATQRAASQGLAAGASPIQIWQQHSQGLSTNAALAFYRVRHANRPYQVMTATRAPRYSTSVPMRTHANYNVTTLYRRPYYAIPAVGYAAPPVVDPPLEPAFSAKPFAQVRHAPNAIDRYWPLLMERREDPNTGLVIWQLP